MFTRSVHSRKCYCLVLAVTLLFAINSADLMAQDGCPDRTFPVMKQKKVTVTIPGTDAIKGYLEALPVSYAAQPTKRFPLMIFFHGINEGGDGSADQLCRLVNQWWWAPPSLVELGKFPQATADKQGHSTQFILISAQLAYFGDPSKAINPLISYLQTKYRIDPSRIYLTGLSAGANFIMTYAGAEASNAKRIAAIAPISPCKYLTDEEAKVIAQSSLGFISVQCGTDGACDGYTASKNEKLINSKAASNKAISITLPVPGWNCNSFTHDSWGTAYDTTFKNMVNGKNINLYEYLLTNVRSGALPVVFRSFAAKLLKNKSLLNWSTASEQNNKQFIIERTGADGVFASVGVVAATNNAAGSDYSFTDEQPLAGFNQYRLVQVDLDGTKNYSEIRTVINRSADETAVVITPNPARGDIMVYLQLPAPQRIQAYVTDLNGKRLLTVDKQMPAGLSPFKLNTAALASGVYYVKIEGVSFSENRKIVKL